MFIMRGKSIWIWQNYLYTLEEKQINEETRNSNIGFGKTTSSKCSLFVRSKLEMCFAMLY